MKEQNPSNSNEKNYSEDKIAKVLFDKILVPKIEKIKGVFSDDFFKEYIKELWNNRNDIYQNDKKYDNRLNNIAIVLNNKIIEVANYYKNHNINFYEEVKKTSLANMIVKDLLFSYELGARFLIKSYSITQKAKDLPDRITTPEQAAEFYNDVMSFLSLLKKYQNTTNRLFNYDVEKNVFASIMNEYYKLDDKTKYKEKIDIYTSQLVSMGLKQQAKEISQYFEKNLNKKENENKTSQDEKTNTINEYSGKEKNIEVSKKQKLFNFYQTKIVKTRHLIEKLKIEDKKIPNVGILLNNKIIEMIHVFNKKGKDFYDFTPLSKIIMGVLEEYYNQAYSALKNNSLDEYKKYCTKIYSFSIEKVIVPYFNDKAKKDESNSFNEKYQNCKDEIISLGYMGEDEER